MKATLSDKVIKRLTLYHFILTECINLGLEYISSPKISELLNIDNSQVRKDVKLLELARESAINFVRHKNLDDYPTLKDKLYTSKATSFEIQVS